MKIWFDLLTPKHVLFFESFIKRLDKKNQILLTSRRYREATELARIRNLKVRLIGKHGGKEKYDKLDASLKRMIKLSTVIKKYSPDITISFCSPEASRISYGLGIKHLGFCNAPFSEAVMRLSVPLLYKLFIPKHIPKKEFTKFGISEKKIIQYNALDEYLIIKGKSFPSTFSKLKLEKKKTILFRTYQTQASYVSGRKNFDMIQTIQKIAKEFGDCNIVVLGRYYEQINRLKKQVGKKIILLEDVVDSGEILSKCDVFVGSGGTMTSEAALRGIPTISYNVLPMPDEKYLVRKGLVKRGKNLEEIISLVRKLLISNKKDVKIRAKKFLKSMEDPYTKLRPVLNSIRE